MRDDIITIALGKFPFRAYYWKSVFGIGKLWKGSNALDVATQNRTPVIFHKYT